MLLQLCRKLGRVKPVSHDEKISEQEFRPPATKNLRAWKNANKDYDQTQSTTDSAGSPETGLLARAGQGGVERHKCCRRRLSGAEEGAMYLLACSLRRPRTSEDGGGERFVGSVATAAIAFGPWGVEELSVDRIMCAVHGVSFVSGGAAGSGPSTGVQLPVGCRWPVPPTRVCPAADPCARSPVRCPGHE